MTSETDHIARAFVSARAQAHALADFPGAPPTELAASYRVQDAAIALWPDKVAGWKIGRVPAAQIQALGAERVAGPIFSRLVWPAKEGEATLFPVFPGGFAAVEAELVFRIGTDAPPEQSAWTRAQAAELVGAMHVGVETAGSPLASINELGATVVAADFGNNHGLILGPEIADWRARLAAGVSAEVFIDGASVGKGAANADADGPLDALAFLAGHLAGRAKPLKAGQYISTGAMTGVHDIGIGQRSRVSFDAAAEILCVAVRASASGKAVA